MSERQQERVCPTCKGKGEIEGMFPTDDGDRIVERVVCPECHDQPVSGGLDRMAETDKTPRRCENSPGHGHGGTSSMTRTTLEERFWAKVDRQGDDDCWPWLASTNFGYGRFSLGDRQTAAHRYAYELLVGPIPEGLQLDHLCRNRGCVNPAHLEPVTNRENTLRGEGWPAENARKTHCPQGHPYDERNTIVEASGSRYCRACNSARCRRNLLRRRLRAGKITVPERAELHDLEAGATEDRHCGECLAYVSKGRPPCHDPIHLQARIDELTEENERLRRFARQVDIAAAEEAA